MDGGDADEAYMAKGGLLVRTLTVRMMVVRMLLLALLTNDAHDDEAADDGADVDDDDDDCDQKRRFLQGRRTIRIVGRHCDDLATQPSGSDPRRLRIRSPAGSSCNVRCSRG